MLVEGNAGEDGAQFPSDKRRVARLLRLLGDGVGEATFSSLCAKAAAVLVGGNATADPNVLEPANDYLVELANRAIPLEDDLLRLLLDHGCLDEWRGAGALRLMEQPSRTIDEIAEALVYAYGSLAEENPAYVPADRLYPDTEQSESVALVRVTMVSAIEEWRERFLSRLEEAVTMARGGGRIDAR